MGLPPLDSGGAWVILFLWNMTQYFIVSANFYFSLFFLSFYTHLNNNKYFNSSIQNKRTELSFFIIARD